MRDKVIQKTMLPRTLFHEQRDPDDVAKQNAMAETISKTMTATLTNRIASIEAQIRFSTPRNSRP
jgi:hypothetical protein